MNVYLNDGDKQPDYTIHVSTPSPQCGLMPSLMIKQPLCSWQCHSTVDWLGIMPGWLHGLPDRAQGFCSD